MSGFTEMSEALEEAEARALAFAEGVQSATSALQESAEALNGLERGLAKGLQKAFDGVTFSAQPVQEALGGLARSASTSAYGAAMGPAMQQLAGGLSDGLLGLVGKITPFAKGGVVSSATPFAMSSGLGVMGEAGPEAILPLARGADGRLGVQGGGRPVQVTLNVTTPNLEGFQRSRSQIGAQLSRLLTQSTRSL